MAKAVKPLLTVVGAAVGFVTLGPAGIFVGAYIGNSLGNSAKAILAPKVKAPATSPSSEDRLTANIDLRTPRKIVVGSTAMATDIRDQEWSADQSYLDRFIVAASHRAQAIREIWFDDKLAWSAAGGIGAPFAGYLTVTPVLEGSAANAIFTSGRMGASRRFTGCAYVHLRYKLTGNGKKAESPFATTIPSRMTIVGDGLAVYDPRLDSTAGGAGPQRANDQSTWAWTESAGRNPALQLLTYLLGWRINGKLAVGKGLPAARIDIASFMTAANLCDEPVARSAGGTEPRYRADGIFSEGDDLRLVLDNFKAAMNAELDDADGRIRISILYNDLASPRAALGAADVLGDFTWDQTEALSDTVNIMRGGYTDASAASLYQMVDYPEVRIAAPDGIDRVETVNLPLVQSASQAQRLVKLKLQRALYAGTFTAVFQATAWRYQKGDIVPFTFPPLGFAAKLFRIAEMTIQVDGTVPMTLREEHAAMYAWDATDAPAVQGAQPTAYLPNLWPIVQGIVDAGTTAEWDGVTGQNKADDNATNSADPNSPFGPGGTVGKAIADLAKLPDITANIERLVEGGVATDDALQALIRAGVDRDGVQRLLGRGSDMLAEAALRLTLSTNRQQIEARDAGIVVDPASGKARLFAVEELRGRSTQLEIVVDAQAGQIRSRATYADLERVVAEAQLEGKDIDLGGLYGRVSDVETNINALNGEIVDRATTAELNALGLTVSEVERRLDSFGDEIGVTTDIRKVRQATDEAARAILGGLVSQDRAGRADRTAIVQARQELTARMDDGAAIQALASTRLGVAIDAVDARLIAESRARIAAGEVVAEDLRALSVTTDDQAGVIADLAKASIDQERGLTVTRSTQRQQVALEDQTAEALLTSLIAGDRTDRRAREQLVQVQSEQTTELVREKLSRAAERVALDARLGASEATAARSAEALAEADRAAARTVELLQAEIDDPNTGLTAAHASIGKVEEVIVGPAGASARAVTVLDVNGRVTGTYNTNDGSTTAFGVVADKFGVYHPTTGALLFYVDGDGAIAASFKPSAIGYDNLAMGAAQKAAFFSIPADISVARGTSVQIVSVTFTKEDTDSILEVQMFANVSSADDLQFTGAIQVDGTTVQSVGVNIVLDNPNSAGRMPITPFAFVPGIAAGQRTVSFVLTNNETDNVALSVLAGSTLKVVELRKGSIGSATGSGAPVVTPGTGGGGGSGGGGYNGGGRPPVAQQ